MGHSYLASPNERLLKVDGGPSFIVREPAAVAAWPLRLPNKPGKCEICSRHYRNDRVDTQMRWIVDSVEQRRPTGGRNQQQPGSLDCHHPPEERYNRRRRITPEIVAQHDR